MIASLLSTPTTSKLFNHLQQPKVSALAVLQLVQFHISLHAIISVKCAARDSSSVLTAVMQQLFASIL
jgi:hypothetical protein